MAPKQELIVPSRRGFLKGLAGILSVAVAPAIIRTPGLIMPIKPLPVVGTLQVGDVYSVCGANASCCSFTISFDSVGFGGYSFTLMDGGLALPEIMQVRLAT